MMNFKLKTLLRTLIFASFALGFLTACEQNLSSENAWPIVQNCDLHQQACVAKHENSSAKLDISPKPLAIAKPLAVKVELENIEAEKLELDISGINMYMGYNRVSLQPQGAGKFSGQTMMAFCTNEVMEWQFTLIAHQADGEPILIPFYLETRNR